MIEVVCGNWVQHQVCLQARRFLRRASGKGSVSQIQLTGWIPEGHEARVKRGERESGCGNAQPRHLCRLLYMYVRQRQDCTQQVVSRPTTRLEQIWCPMGDQPSTSATSRFIVLQYSGARRSARECALDLCSMLAATDDAETIRAAAGQGRGQRAAGVQDNRSTIRSHTVGVLRDGREAINQAAMCFSRQTQGQLNR